MAQAGTGAACGGMLCSVTCPVAGATRVTPRPVQRVNVAFLVQGDGHAAAKPAVFAGRSPSM
ncbi:hypothetical protein C2U36_21895 [Escherichia coli]|nr:hypothetical protein C2U36_21895 [Escherichia coli]